MILYRDICLKSMLGRKNPLGKFMWGETFERDVIFSLWWLVGELEALVLSCIEDTALLGLG